MMMIITIKIMINNSERFATTQKKCKINKIQL